MYQTSGLTSILKYKKNPFLNLKKKSGKTKIQHFTTVWTVNLEVQWCELFSQQNWGFEIGHWISRNVAHGVWQVIATSDNWQQNIICKSIFIDIEELHLSLRKKREPYRPCFTATTQYGRAVLGGGFNAICFADCRHFRCLLFISSKTGDESYFPGILWWPRSASRWWRTRPSLVSWVIWAPSLSITIDVINNEKHLGKKNDLHFGSASSLSSIMLLPPSYSLKLLLELCKQKFFFWKYRPRTVTQCHCF